MAFHKTRTIFIAAAFWTLAIQNGRAECLTAGEWWLRSPGVEAVFSGTVVEIDRIPPFVYRYVLDVDRVWKGDVTKRFVLYVSEVIGEQSRLELRERYVVGARRLQSTSERAGVGLTDTDALAHTEIN